MQSLGNSLLLTFFLRSYQLNFQIFMRLNKPLDNIIGIIGGMVINNNEFHIILVKRLIINSLKQPFDILLLITRRNQDRDAFKVRDSIRRGILIIG